MTCDDELDCDDVEVNPQVRRTEAGRERTWEFLWPEWHALQELARRHGYSGAVLSVGQTWSAADARPFCDALERALAVLSDDDVWPNKCAESFPPKQRCPRSNGGAGSASAAWPACSCRPGGTAA